ncbi:TPM domain-containing protein [Streptococcus suis]
MRKIIFGSILVLSFLLSIPVAAYDVPDMPQNGIYDPMGLLTNQTIVSIEEQNTAAAQTDLKPQVAVVVVDSLHGESVEEVANQFATTWKVGFPDTNAGTLLLLAINDREYRFELSDNASEYLSEIEAYFIGENNKHYLRQQNYDLAIRQMTTDMFTELNGNTAENAQFNVLRSQENARAEGILDYQPPSYEARYEGDHSSGDNSWGLFLAFFSIPFVFILGMLGNGRRSYRTRSYLYRNDVDHHASHHDSYHSRSNSRTISSSGRIGHGGGGFPGRGSSGKW